MTDTHTASPLPVELYKEVLQKTIALHPITIVSAETGAGKSTQIPLWYFMSGQKVVVTQPKRIATRALSHFVSSIVGCEWGKEIGYQTGTDQKKSKETRLLYLTDGVQMLNEIRGKTDYDLLILDEIHEWNLNQEILVGQVKKNLLKGVLKKTIIMSATFNSNRLSHFLNNAPIVTIPGRGFPVSRHIHSPSFILSDVSQLVQSGQNVLVFQPGKAEIQSFSDLLKDSLKEDGLKAQILPLHSELSIKEQSRVFAHYSVSKVVVSTDVAQTSLTIDDIDAVVDTGIKKEVRLNNGIEGLYPTDISQAECHQRAGRAGRTRPGQYILCSEREIADRPPFQDPEISRLNLDSVVLRMLKWGLSPDSFPFFHPPSHLAIRKAIGRLITFGAITNKLTLTDDGHKMAELPVSIRSARLLLEGLKGPKETIIDTMRMIAIIETRGIINHTLPPQKLHPYTLRSDLLNQLYIWKNQKSFRSQIHYKKMQLAQEILAELKRRISPMLPCNAKIDAADANRHLLRTCLSAFPDHVYERINQRYCTDNEERQLDRQSSLNETPPAMLTGLPFDLNIRQQDPISGEEKHVLLALITMASEISWDLLKDLRPFSFRTVGEYSIQNKQLIIVRSYFFGGQKLMSRSEPANWQSKVESESLTRMIIDWANENAPASFIENKKALEKAYNMARQHVTTPMPIFPQAWDTFLAHVIMMHLDHDDLGYFFQFHSSIQQISMKNLLPDGAVSELRKANWPDTLESSAGLLPIKWLGKNPFIITNMDTILTIKSKDLCLCTGDTAGIILNRKRFFRWEQVCSYYNRLQKKRLFALKWAEQKKTANLSDIKDVHFPQSFIGGYGLDNQPFEFYICPNITTDNTIELIHFFSIDQAKTHMALIVEKWQKMLSDHHRQILGDMFKNKGWTVR